MAKLTEENYRKKNYHREFSAPARGYIHGNDHYFQTTFLKTNQGQTLCGALLERGNVNFVKMVSLT